MDVRKTVVNSFVISEVDYCNSLLAGVPRYQLDRLLNRTINCRRQEARPHQARAAGSPPLASRPTARPDQVVSAKDNLQGAEWLAPSYIADLCRPDTSVDSRQRLRSANRGDLVVCSSVTHFGTGAFAVVDPRQRPGTNCRCTYEHGRQLKPRVIRPRPRLLVIKPITEPMDDSNKADKSS